MTVYQEIFEVIKARKAAFEAGTAQENSYTAYLFDKGVDKICKKVDHNSGYFSVSVSLRDDLYIEKFLKCVSSATADSY